MNVRWTDVQGVATLFAETGQVSGPLRACLMFGTGRADESLKNSGINHIVEHLALHGSGATSALMWNGEVNTLTTRFWAVGTPDPVVEYLAFVARQLGALPLDRLEQEIQVLEIEGQRHRGSQIAADLAQRFGPFGAGLLGWSETGLRTLGPTDVSDWCRDRFTTGNASLWLSGPVPDGITLRGLPAGDMVDHHEAPTSLVPERTYWAVESSRVSLSFVSPPAWGTARILEIARRRAHEQLRDDAMSYAVEQTMIPVGGGERYWCFDADGADHNLDRVMLELIASVERLAAEGPTDAEVARLRDFDQHFGGGPDAIEAYFEAAARARLFGTHIWTPEEIEVIHAAHTPESLRAELVSLLPSMVAMGPQQSFSELSGWTEHADCSKDTVTGTRYEPITGRERGALTVGTDGVTWEAGAELRRTVRWSDVEVCFVDGDRRVLYDTAGTELFVAPGNWRDGDELASLVDAAVDPSRLVAYRPPDTGARTSADPTELRWLGTIAGAKGNLTWNYRWDLVTLVIDTDGIFVLQDDAPAPDNRRRLHELRTADREALLARDPRNRWINQREIREVELRKGLLGRIGAAEALLVIRTGDDEKYALRLTTGEQVEIAREQLPRVLGERFRHTNSSSEPRVAERA